MRERSRKFFWFIGLALVMSGGTASAQSGQDVLEKLGLGAAEAKTEIVEALASGSVFSEPAFKAFKAMAPSARASIVKSGLAWIKNFTGTTEFKAGYLKYREEHKPEAPGPKLSADTELKKQRAELEKQIAEMQKGMAGLDAETRKSLEEAVKAMRAQMDAMEKDPEQKKMYQEMYDQQAADEKQAYAERLKAWEDEYPADPKALIISRIRNFLGESHDVDFGAKLVKRGSLMRFENEEYEGRSGMWKLCFRAGKEAVEAARTFAFAWLAELEK